MHRTLLALALTGLFLTACAESVTEPVQELDTPEVVFAKGGNENGVQFFPSPFIGITHVDAGNLCRVRTVRDLEDASDFIRVNPDGSEYIHINDAEATLYIETVAGDILTGDGRWNLNWGGHGNNVSHAVGTVSDGTNTYRALCHYTLTKSGKVNNSVDVH